MGLGGVGACFEEMAGDISSFCQGVKTHVEWFDREVKVWITANFPVEVLGTVLKIYESIPEILLITATALKVAVLPATLFWSYRVLTTVSPCIKTLLSGPYTQEAFVAAANTTSVNLYKAYKQFVPAIAVCYVVSTYFLSFAGALAMNYNASIRATIHAAIACLAIEKLIQD